MDTPSGANRRPSDAERGEPRPWRRGLTRRSLLIGAALVALGSVWAPHSIWGLGSSEITWSYMPLVVVFPFFVVVLLNTGVKALRPQWALRQAELVVIFAMELVSAGTPIFLTGFLLGLLASPYYLASAENRWAECLHPHLPHWAFPSNAGNAMRWFFEGLPRGHSRLPWAEWVVPLAWWLSLVAAFYFVCLCLVVMLRRQWVERERLVYPLLAVPRALVGTAEDERRVPRLLRDRLFWLGFAVPVGVIGWSAIAYFAPAFPSFNLRGTNIRFGEGFPAICVTPFFPIIGLAYFANSEVILSVWLFHVLGVVQEGIYNRVGFSIGRSSMFCWGMAATGWQSFGAFVVMVLVALWMARRHLWAVVATALGHGTLDDSNEILSYRLAVVGLVGGTAYLTVWLWRSGLSIRLALAFLATVYVIYLGLARIIAQTGVAYVTPPMVAQPFLMHTLGTASMSPRDLAGLCCAYGWHGDVQTTFAVGAAQDAKLADAFRVHGRGLLPALVVSVVVGFAASTAFLLLRGYAIGAANFGSWTFRPAGGMGDQCFSIAVEGIADPQGPHRGRLACFGVGAGAMAALMFLKYRFAWWPLHPVGLAVASVWTIRRTAFSVFLAWGIKVVLLRLGGVRLYRRAAPFFIGLILGCFTGIALAQLVDAIWFYGRGHFIYNG